MKPLSKTIYDKETINKRIDALLSDEKVSFASIQRCFNIGYPTAGRLIDEMLSLGLIISQDLNLAINAKFDFSKKEQLRKYLYNKMEYYHH